MYNKFERVIPINDTTLLKFIEDDAPFYSKLYLYHDNKRVSDCSFKPEEKKQIKEAMQSYTSLINTLKTISNAVNNKYLNEFIELIESYRKNNHQTSPGTCSPRP